MYLINGIEMNYEPREKIISALPAAEKSEITKDECAFLCGLLNKKKPRKIVEIGLAAGGTTAIILQCMEDLKVPYELYSVDRSVNYYRDIHGGKESGFIGDEAKKILNPKKAVKFLGDVLPAFMPKIGDGIDFVMLDTMHVLPGEILDFLVLLPYLSKDAVICMHDIARSLYENEDSSGPFSYATTTLFSAVTGDKYLNFFNGGAVVVPNIGAFKVTEFTKDNIFNLFLTLTMRWYYMPHISDIEKYTMAIHQHYERDLCRIFDEARLANAANMFPLPQDLIPKDKRITIYGGGVVGQAYWYQLKKSHNIIKWVDKNSEERKKDIDFPISNIDKDAFDNCDYIILAARPMGVLDEMRECLRSFGVDESKIIVPNCDK